MSLLDRILRKRKRFTPTEEDAIWRGDTIPFTNTAVCRTCGKLLDRDKAWHKGHEQSVHNFGSNNLANMSVQCPACNLSLGASNMTLTQRISLRTWIKLFIVAATLAAASILIFSCSTAFADTTGPRPPKTDRWTTTATIKRDALKLSARIGQTQAFNKRNGKAAYHFGLALKSWNLKTVRSETRAGWKALRQ